MTRLILILIYTLLLIVGLLVGYQYYIKYRNCLTPSTQSKYYPILCKECNENKIVQYSKNIDNNIFKTEQEKEIQEILDEMCDIYNTPIYLAYNISRYLDFNKDFPSLDKKNNINCCNKCYNRKYLNKNVEKWEIWIHHKEGYIPKKKGPKTSVFNFILDLAK